MSEAVWAGGVARFGVALLGVELACGGLNGSGVVGVEVFWAAGVGLPLPAPSRWYTVVMPGGGGVLVLTGFEALLWSPRTEVTLLLGALPSLGRKTTVVGERGMMVKPFGRELATGLMLFGRVLLMLETRTGGMVLLFVLTPLLRPLLLVFTLPAFAVLLVVVTRLLGARGLLEMTGLGRGVFELLVVAVGRFAAVWVEVPLGRAAPVVLMVCAGLLELLEFTLGTVDGEPTLLTAFPVCEPMLLTPFMFAVL